MQYFRELHEMVAFVQYFRELHEMCDIGSDRSDIAWKIENKLELYELCSLLDQMMLDARKLTILHKG